MWRYPPRSIVAAVDFGEAAASALRAAGTLAQAFDAELIAVHAESFEAPPYFTREQLDAIEKQRQAARREATSYLGRFAQSHAGIAVTPVISESAPASAILDASRTADLVVMGTHGRRGPARWWAGSVAERVVREALLPVLVVRAGTDGSRQMFQRIAPVTQGGGIDNAAQKYARSLAARFETALDTESMDNATLVVLARNGYEASGPVASATERLVRGCRRPLLFVPPY